PMTILRNTDNGNMNVGQKWLPLFLRHRQRHRRPPGREASSTNSIYPESRNTVNAASGAVYSVAAAPYPGAATTDETDRGHAAENSVRHQPSGSYQRPRLRALAVARSTLRQRQVCPALRFEQLADITAPSLAESALGNEQFRLTTPISMSTVRDYRDGRVAQLISPDVVVEIYLVSS